MFACPALPRNGADSTRRPFSLARPAITTAQP